MHTENAIGVTENRRTDMPGSKGQRTPISSERQQLHVLVRYWNGRGRNTPVLREFLRDRITKLLAQVQDERVRRGLRPYEPNLLDWD